MDIDDDDNLRWEALGPSNQWHDNDAREFRFGARRIAVVKHQQAFYAFKNRCPHRGLPLIEERPAALTDGCISCPHHGWSFQLADGQGPEESCLRTYPIRLTDGELFVGL